MMIFKNNRSAGIIIAIFIILIVSVIGVVVASLLGTETRSVLNYLQSQQAYFIAESGKEYVVAKLRSDSDYRSEPTTVNQSFANGSFSVGVTDGYTLTSTGIAGSATRQIIQSVTIGSSLTDKAIHADGSLVDFTGSTGTVNGDISCHVSVTGYGGMTINGTITEGLARLNPTLDFSYYAGIADHYSTSNLTFANGTYNGVYYTTKKATIGNNVTLNGSIIAVSSIDFNGKANNVRINPSNNYPALASNSSINSTDTGPPSGRIGLQNSTINGLIFCTGNITFDYGRNNTFNGTILSNGNINLKSGLNWTIAYDEDIFSPMTPGLEAGEMIAEPQGDWNEVY